MSNDRVSQNDAPLPDVEKQQQHQQQRRQPSRPYLARHVQEAAEENDAGGRVRPHVGRFVVDVPRRQRCQTLAQRQVGGAVAAVDARLAVALLDLHLAR